MKVKVRPAGCRVFSPRAWVRASAIETAMEIAVGFDRRGPETAERPDTPGQRIDRFTDRRIGQLVEIFPKGSRWH